MLHPRPALQLRFALPLDPAARRRAIAIALTLAIEALLLFLLLRAIVGPPTERIASEATNFSLDPQRSTNTAAAREQPRPRAEREVAVRPAIVPKTPPIVVTPPLSTSPYVVVSKEDLAAGDISKLADARSGAGKTTGSGSGSGRTYGPGEGPGGAPLYNAEWVREPTDGELALYLPETRQPGTWGMVACRTIPGNRVEDCRALGESPGSRLASALRQASWQFRVRPPREGDKPLIGVWVRIRFDIREKSAG